MSNLKKTAIVTGATRGIGFAIAKTLGAEGYNLVLSGTRDADENEEALKAIAETGAEYLYVRSDVGKSEDRKILVREALERFGEIHALVNNAGVAPLERADLLDMSEESFDRVVGINTKGNLFLTQAVAKVMLSQEYRGKKRGTIINISSCSAEVVSVNRGEYCVSKAGISMLTKLFAARLAGDGILVHEVRPGVIATDMTAKVKEKYDGLIAGGLFPVKRWGMPEDVANVVKVLASDDILYTTGNYIDVDGGFHLKQL
ncbi:MAG: 3-ketoacyl-ACP reductase [Fusobacteriaceae bacterium]|jgi:NAD(P)-dependent dehydrogenase (short-subunit alcohol dehydrogenase family)|nr:3-ketoacyl-ACP reductase [Fusobacteriaceae bacterium]